VAVGWADTTAQVTSVSDSAGNVYSLGIGPTLGTGVTQAVYYAANIVATDAGTNAVTVSFDRAPTLPDVRIAELAGAIINNPFDTADAGVGNGPIAASGSVTTTTSHEIVIGAGMSTGGFTDAGKGFTIRVISSDGNILEDDVAGSSGAAGQATAPVDTSGPNNWVMQVLLFKGC
jgi:hypothetical protein